MIAPKSKFQISNNIITQIHIFKDFGENLGSEHKPSFDLLKELAKSTKKLIIGGSIPELDNQGKVFNTSLVFDPNGNVIAKHRKIHMFDIDIPGIRFRESDAVTAGNQVTVFNTQYCKMGLGICYDIRFPEQALIMAQQGAEVLIYPAAFNATTGPLHFELLGKARALDTQAFIVLASQARDFTDKIGYQSWGHSVVINPNGLVIAQAELKDKLILTDIDLDDVTQQKRGFPFETQRRKDLYEVRYKGNLSGHEKSESVTSGNSCLHSRPKVGYPWYQKEVMNSIGEKNPVDGNYIEVGYKKHQIDVMNEMGTLHTSAMHMSPPKEQACGFQNPFKDPKVGYSSHHKEVMKTMDQIPVDGKPINIGYSSAQKDIMKEQETFSAKSKNTGYPQYQKDIIKSYENRTVSDGKGFSIGYTAAQKNIMVGKAH